MYKSRDNINFETFTYEMGWYSTVNVKFDYSVCLVPKDWKNHRINFEREEFSFRFDLPYKFYEKHPPLRYVELSKDNQYGIYLDLACDVSNYPSYMWPLSELSSYSYVTEDKNEDE